MTGQLLPAHAKYVEALQKHYEEAAHGRQKDIFGFDLPLPPLPPHVPHSDPLFVVFACSLLLLVILPSAISLLLDAFRWARADFGPSAESASGAAAAASTGRRPTVSLAAAAPSFLPSVPARQPPQSLDAKSAGRSAKLWTLFRLLVAVPGLAIVCYLLATLEFPEDPYVVLGLPRGASADQIKRAWRDLALRFHPDKRASSDADVGSASGDAEFLRISRAYRTLTEDAAGFSSVLLIGLPEFLSEASNQVYVILGYFGLLCLVGTLVVFWRRVTRSRKEQDVPLPQPDPTQDGAADSYLYDQPEPAPAASLYDPHPTSRAALASSLSSMIHQRKASRSNSAAASSLRGLSGMVRIKR